MRIYTRCALTVLSLLALSSASVGQCRLLQTRVFEPQNKRIKLVTRPGDTTETYKAIFFRTSLRVNTDGAPNSYHPDDLTGSVKAINNICNGIAVYKLGSGGTQTTMPCQTARQIFGQFRNSNWTVPAGYAINWQNVIAPRVQNGKSVPCVFQTGEMKGYFGSLTSLKNGLSGSDAGECESKNQLDQRFVPAFVMPGGQNPLRTFGAGVGDLLVVYNPQNSVMSVAIVGDTGPRDKLGEGSVALNMSLLRRENQPVTYHDALQLDTGNKEMLISIIPNSKIFELKTPFSKENLRERFEKWLGRSGFASEQDFITFMKACDSE